MVRVEGITPSEAREAWIDDHCAGSEEKGRGMKGASVVVGVLEVCAKVVVANEASPRIVYFMLKAEMVIVCREN